MSIIHDALKKVQESSKSAPPQKTTREGEAPSSPVSHFSPSAPSPDISSDSDNLPRPVVIALGISMCIMVAIVFLVLFRLARETTVHPKLIVSNAAPMTPPKSVEPAVPAQPPPPPSPVTESFGLRLQGIMDMGGKKVALINDEIYEEGQVVDGKIIAAITITGVTLLENGIKKYIPIKKPSH